MLEKEQIMSGYAGIASTQVYYEMMGEGSPIVLIHGGNLDQRWI